MSLRGAVALSLAVTLLTLCCPALALDDGVKISPWAREGVEHALETGLVAQDNSLGEDLTKPVTREQLARLLVGFVCFQRELSPRQLGAVYGVSFPVEVQADEEPEPTREGFSFIKLLAFFGLSTGKDTEEASEAEPEPETVSIPFSDTDSPYVALASAMEIVKGDKGLFRPADKVSRAEAAAMLRRTLALFDITQCDCPPLVFSDAWDIPRWAAESVKFVSGRTDGAGVPLMGGDGGRFSPRGSLTIEQAVLTLPRMSSSCSVIKTYPGWRDAQGYDTVSITMSFGGDCTLGRGLGFGYKGSFDEMYDLMGEEYFFSGIDEFFNDDLSMVNFEGTLTESTRAAVKTFVFKGRPQYAGVLTAGSIDVVSIANNHSMDYLQQGYEDTIANLSGSVAVSGNELMPIIQVKGVKVGFVSRLSWEFNSREREFIESAVSSLRSQGAELVVFNYHWGMERNYSSNATQRAIAHCCIDAGADLVIGHHPHVTQDTETYKGKQIAYSLGNLVFGGNTNPADKNCLIAQSSFTLDLDSRQIVAQSHEAIPYRVSSVDYRNDYHPVRAAS